MVFKQYTNRHMNRRFILSAAVIGLAGCLSGQALASGYLPGSNDMAQGPGLLSGGHYDKSNHGGTVLFSTNKNKSAYVHSGDIKSGSYSHKVQSASQAGSGQATNEPRHPTSHATEAAAKARGHGTNTQGHSSSSYQRFKSFQRYQQFKNLPRNSPQRRKFRRWLKWRKNHR